MTAATATELELRALLVMKRQRREMLRFQADQLDSEIGPLERALEQEMNGREPAEITIDEMAYMMASIEYGRKPNVG